MNQVGWIVLAWMGQVCVCALYYYIGWLDGQKRASTGDKRE